MLMRFLIIMRVRLTPQLIESIAGCVLDGLKRKYICRIIGINERTFRNWRQRGRTETEGIYHDLNKAIEAAEVQRRRKLEKLIYNDVYKDDIPDTKTALKMLERQYPEEWAPAHRIIVENLSPTQFVELLLNSQYWEDLPAKLRKSIVGVMKRSRAYLCIPLHSVSDSDIEKLENSEV